MIVYRDRDTLYRRMWGLAGVLGVHALFLAAFWSPWTSRPEATVSASVKKIDIFFPETRKSNFEPAVLPKPLNETPAIDVTMPVIDIEPPKEEVPDEKQSVAVTELAGDPDYPLTAPEYPRQSLALGEAGRVIMKVSIRPDGSVSDVLIVSGSGFALLDEAARNQALHAWRFRPTAAEGLRTFTVSLRFELLEG